MLKRCISLRHACNVLPRSAVNLRTIRTLTVEQLIKEATTNPRPRTRVEGEDEAEELRDHEPRRKPLARRPAYNPKSLQEELRWLKDPVRLADHVKRLLLQSEVTKVIELLELASKTQKCTVAWNLLLDHIMKLGRVNDALKRFNDMKKRGQAPDSYTYTTILRGLAKQADHVPTAPARAVALFHSMSAPNSRVEPRTMHANAALSVCARANAADELWGIISRLPESGPCAPDHITYSIVLTFLRDQVLADPAMKEFVHPQRLKPLEDGKEKMQEVEDTLLRGRRVWTIIRDKWMNGDITVEESLVCAMGRLLLLSNDVGTVQDVFALVEQTTGVPNLCKANEKAIAPPSGGSPAVETDEHGRSLPLDEIPFEGLEESLEETTKPVQVPPRLVEEAAEFAPIPQLISGQAATRERGAGSIEKPKGRPPRHVPISYVKAGNNTLSLLLEACLKLRLKQTALDYFSLLTTESGPGWEHISPDEGSLDMLLRVFRAARDSRQAVDVLETRFPAAGLKPSRGSYLIALSACARRLTNFGAAFQDADKIVRMMFEQGVYQPRFLSVYITVTEMAKGRAEHVAAVERVWPAVELLKGYALGQERARDFTYLQCVAFFQGLRGRISHLLDPGILGKKLDEEYKQDLKAKMKVLDAIIFDAHHQKPPKWTAQATGREGNRRSG